MTIKEMIKQVETYNKMNQFTHNHNIQLAMKDISYSYCTDSYYIENYKEFSKEIRETFIDKVAHEFLTRKDFEFDQEIEIGDGTYIFMIFDK